MYHEVLADGRAPARPGAGYARYVIADRTLREHVGVIRSAGAVGVAVGDALAEPDSAEARVVLTFDDGCASDLLVAAPLLRAAGFGATFFVTVAHLDTPGFLTRGQLRELADAGFEIGSHGMTHEYMSDLAEAGIRSELADSKAALEALTGRPVEHFSCPGGRWSRQVADLAREAGYASVSDSRPVSNPADVDRYRLGRFAITTAVSPALIRRIATSGVIAVSPVRQAILRTTKRLLGNHMYDRVRRFILERGAP